MVSASGGASLVLQVTNARSAAVDAYWLDWSGARVFYWRVQPGRVARQQTYAGHPWLFVDAATGACVRLVGDPAAESTITLR